MSVSSSPTPLGSSPQFSASSNSLSPRIKHPTVPKIVLPKTLNEVLLVECFKHVQNLVEVKDRKQYFKSHKSCFVGKDLVTAIFNSFVFENRKQALRFGRLFEDKVRQSRVSSSHLLTLIFYNRDSLSTLHINTDSKTIITCIVLMILIELLFCYFPLCCHLLRNKTQIIQIHLLPLLLQKIHPNQLNK